LRQVAPQPQSGRLVAKAEAEAAGNANAKLPQAIGEDE
jgi:hypothetical protein